MLSVLSSFTLFLVVLFVAYVIAILIPFLRHKPIPLGDPAAFTWHLFVPCRDEAAVIEATMHRARTDFPDAHLWIIDDDSSDNTARIVSQFAARDAHVHLVQRRLPDARLGKGAALNGAYRALDAWLPARADRERIIVGVLDADGEMSPDALEVVASARVFGDPLTGAAQIAVWMRNRADRTPFPERGRLANRFASALVRMQDVEFRTVIAAMQSLRVRTGTVGLGGNGQFTRLSVLDVIGEQHGAPWHGALLEDYELGLHVLLAGYQVRHAYDTHVSQEALPSVRRLLTQRTRWAQGNIQCAKYLRDVINSPKFDSVGVLETAYYMLLPFLQLLGVIAMITMTAISIGRVVAEPSIWSAAPERIIPLIVLVLLFSVAPFAIWGFVYKARCEPSASWGQALLWGLGMWLYICYMYVCIPRAFVRIARGQTGWSKTRRNAEALVRIDGSVAVEK